MMMSRETRKEKLTTIGFCLHATLAGIFLMGIINGELYPDSAENFADTTMEEETASKHEAWPKQLADQIIPESNNQGSVAQTYDLLPEDHASTSSSGPSTELLDQRFFNKWIKKVREKGNKKKADELAKAKEKGMKWKETQDKNKVKREIREKHFAECIKKESDGYCAMNKAQCTNDGKKQVGGLKEFQFITRRTRGGQDLMQLSEVKFRYKGQDVVLHDKGCTASNPGGHSPHHESASMAIDGNKESKWLDFDRKPLLISCKQSFRVDEVTYVTANDASERDPIEWTVKGKLEDKWVELLVKKYDFPSGKHQYQLPWFGLAAKLESYLQKQTEALTSQCNIQYAKCTEAQKAKREEGAVVAGCEDEKRHKRDTGRHEAQKVKTDEKKQKREKKREQEEVESKAGVKEAEEKKTENKNKIRKRIMRIMHKVNKMEEREALAKVEKKKQEQKAKTDQKPPAKAKTDEKPPAKDEVDANTANRKEAEQKKKDKDKEEESRQKKKDKGKGEKSREKEHDSPLSQEERNTLEKDVKAIKRWEYPPSKTMRKERQAKKSGKKTDEKPPKGEKSRETEHDSPLSQEERNALEKDVKAIKRWEYPPSKTMRKERQAKKWGKR